MVIIIVLVFWFSSENNLTENTIRFQTSECKIRSWEEKQFFKLDEKLNSFGAFCQLKAISVCFIFYKFSKS
jgi:hypothetical protein